MKKLILSLFAVLASISVNAQTVNVHLKNGEAVRYNSTEVDYVDFSEESVDPTPVPTPVPSIGNPVITFSVNIVNRSGKDVTLDGTVEFLLGNPDHNGTYLGWEGSYNYTDPIRFSSSPVTLAAGQTKTFDGLTWRDEETGSGMGEKSPLDPNQWATPTSNRNVKLYVGGSDELVVCDNMDPNIIFKEGGFYTIVISSVKDPTPVPTPVPSIGNPVITFSVNIINRSGRDVTLDGEVEFLLGNPDHNGAYLGWEGSYNYTDPIRFSSTPVYLAAGQTKTFDGLTWRDEETGWGMGEKSPLDPSQWTSPTSNRNVKLYVGGSDEVVICDNMDPSIIFKEGGIYTIVISSVDNPTPVNPSPVVGNPVVTFSLNIINRSGKDVTLDGTVEFLLGNPDHNGTYLGWEGSYNYTDPIRFSGSSVTLAAGETKTFYGLTWRDEETGSGMGEKSPLDPSQWASPTNNRNVKLYVGGSDEVVVCDNMDPSIIFKEGGIYSVVISSAK